ncbi:unnamed protein product, partial [Owenia fusiformis]
YCVFSGDVIRDLFRYQHASLTPLLMHSGKHHPLQPAPHMNKSTSPSSYQRQNRKVKNKVQCTLCLKAFRSQAHLSIHMNSHTGDKPFKCNICFCAFGHPFALTRHNRKFHASTSATQMSLPQ